MNKKFDSIVTEFKRGLVRELLDQCTPSQVHLFNRMYGGIDVIADDQMRTAYTQCQATIRGNKAKGEEGGT